MVYKNVTKFWAFFKGKQSLILMGSWKAAKEYKSKLKL